MVGAYGTLAYAETLSHIGTAVWLPNAGGAMLSREIEGQTRRDLVGNYPWTDFADWGRVAADLEHLSTLDDPPVAAVTVVSPLVEVPDEVMQSAFPDHLVDFKQHQLVDLTGDFVGSFRSSHRRKMRRIDPSVNLGVEVDLDSFAPDWIALYGHLSTRHGIGGAADFPDCSLRLQLALPGVVVFSARLDGEVIGAVSFVCEGDQAAYHLGAFAPAGYQYQVAFGLFPLAFEVLRERGISVVNLGGGAGARTSGDDGLLQFKRGWATHAKYARIGGRVLDADVYASLSAGTATDFFPAYRRGAGR